MDDTFKFNTEISGWLGYFRLSPPTPGGSDILCAGWTDPLGAAAGFASTISGLVNTTGEPAYLHIVVIFPANTLDSQTSTDLIEKFFHEVMERVRRDFAKHGEDIDASLIEAALRRRIKIKIGRNQQTTNLIEFVKSLPDSTAVFLVDSELYSPDQRQYAPIITSDEAIPGEGLRTHLEEDLWVNNLHHTAAELTRLAENKQLFILLFVQKFGPTRAENLQLLKSIENCAFVTTSSPIESQNDDSVVMSNASRWLSLARDQKIDDVIKEIDGAAITPINRALVKAQCLMVAGRPLLSFEIIEPFLEQIKGGDDPQLILSASRIASWAGRHSTSLDLLRSALGKYPSGEFELNVALQLAHSLGAHKEWTWVLDRLTRLYPRAITAINHKFGACHDRLDYQKLAHELEPRSGSSAADEEIQYLYLLASAFGDHEVPDYELLVQNIASTLPAHKYRAILACATHALRRGLFGTAATLCLNVAWPKEAEEDAAWRVVSALEGLFLRKYEAQEDKQNQTDEQIPSEKVEELLHQCLVFLLNYLSRNTSDGTLRAALSRVMSPEIGGLNGIFHLSNVVLNSPPPDVVNTDEAAQSAELLPLDEFTLLYETILPKLPSPMLLGIGKLPPVQTHLSLESFLNSITVLLRHTSMKSILDETDVHFIYILLHIAILVGRELKVENEPELIGVAAAGLAASGNYQSSRNLAEFCLQLSSQSANQQRREAWLCYSDIYLRCHNPMEALIGLGCVLQNSNDPITSNHRYHEIVLTCRILRDLRLFPLAIPLIPLAREQAFRTINPEQALRQLDYLEVSLRFQVLMWKGNDISQAEKLSELKALAKRVVDLNRRAREGEEEILPTTLLLAQINGLLISYGEPIDVQVQKELENSLPIVGEKHVEVLTAFATDSPTADTIKALAWALPKTRYNEDFGTDVTVITLLARHALAGTTETGDASQTLFLLEWLTDLSLNTFESDQFTRSTGIDVAERALRRYTDSAILRANFTAQKEELLRVFALDAEADPSLQVQDVRYPDSPEELAGFARELSRQGLDVHSIGITNGGSLVRVSAEEGDISVSIEPAAVFNSDAHNHWEERYPYAYKELKVDDPFALNEVEQSLAGIGISPTDSGRPMLLIPDVRLQNVPPNLLLVNGEIGGLNHPIASSPSLTWLKAVRSFEQPQNGRRYAWIPASDVPGDILFRLSEELADTLHAYHFNISNDPVIPTGMINLDLAIIGAHGGLQGENEWFRVVADEGSTRLSARDVASKLRGSRVVILFVCSGGRLDRHPYASAGVGLPRLLLDHGCRTVIAAPWPVDVRVAAYWLPAFLDAFTRGERVVTANHTANRTVAEKFNPHPMLSLAMNVFGDPLTTCVKETSTPYTSAPYTSSPRELS